MYVIKLNNNDFLNLFKNVQMNKNINEIIVSKKPNSKIILTIGEETFEILNENNNCPYYEGIQEKGFQFIIKKNNNEKELTCLNYNIFNTILKKFIEDNKEQLEIKQGYNSSYIERLKSDVKTMKNMNEKLINRNNNNKEKTLKNNVYYEMAAPSYNSNYKPHTLDILKEILNLSSPKDVEEKIKPSPENIPKESTVIYKLFLPGPRFDSKAKWARLGKIINSGANLVICLFRCAAGYEPLEPMALEINPPYVPNAHTRLNMIEFMVNMQINLQKTGNFQEHYEKSKIKLKNEITE